MKTKQEIRTKIYEKLKNINFKKERENEVVKKALSFILFNGYKKIALYLSKENELSIDDLIQALFSANIDVYLPVTVGENDLIFTKITSESKFHLGKFGIREPFITVIETDFDVIFVPLVAFDSHNNRLGHGKGYYDRFLHGKKAIKVGLAFNEQMVDFLPTSKFDIPLDDVFYC